MRHDPRALLEDMRRASSHVLAFTADCTWEAYACDVLLQSAVERQLEIAAEALNRLLRLSPDLAKRITDYRTIIDFRNFLSHGYDLVEPQVVWDIIEKEVPVLLQEVENLLIELGEE